MSTSTETSGRLNSGSHPWRSRDFGFSARELAQIEVMIQEHREAMVEAWHEYFGS
jgi:hypothetical protein